MSSPPPSTGHGARLDEPSTIPPRAWRFLVVGVRNLLRVLFGWRLRTRVEGPITDAHRPAVVVANHTGNLEPFLVAYCVWRATGHWIQPLAKAELFGVPVLGFLGRHAGGIPVERETEGGRTSAYGAAVARLHEGGTIYVAAEGTITHDGSLLPLRHGAARLALEADVPVLVVTSFGGQRAFSPVAGRPHRNAVFDVVVEQLVPDASDDAASLTGRIAATMMDRSEELRADYPDQQPDAPWWPPYSEPAEPSRTARENLDQYREAMTEQVARARERMEHLTHERHLDERLADARQRASEIGAQLRARAEELGDTVRQRTDELVELGRTGELGDAARHRAEELAARARELADQARLLGDEARHLVEEIRGPVPSQAADPAGDDEATGTDDGDSSGADDVPAA